MRAPIARRRYGGVSPYRRKARAARGLQPGAAVADTEAMAKRQLVDRRRVERRKELRFETKMWVGIADTEGDPEVESCNISAGGMLLRTNRDAGAPGAVRMLRLVTSDLGGSIEIMGLIVRVEHADSASSSGSGREITGVAFEFLPLNTEELDEFLGVVVEGEFTVGPVRSQNPPIFLWATISSTR